MADSVANIADDHINDDMCLSIVREFSRAWKDRDINDLMSMMADNCVYSASVGPEPGMRFIGKGEVRAGFEQMLVYDFAEHEEIRNLFVYKNRVVREWHSLSSDVKGDEVVVHGCDLFTLVNGKISAKDSFRKSYPRTSPGDVYDGEDYHGAI